MRFLAGQVINFFAFLVAVVWAALGYVAIDLAWGETLAWPIVLWGVWILWAVIHADMRRSAKEEGLL